MSDQPEIRTHEDFTQVYDLDDPRPYYRALAPVDYRMPGVTAGFLRANAAAFAEFFGVKRLRALDFACGFGAVAALLRHDLTMAAFFDRYADDADGPLPAADAGFFAARRETDTHFEIGGLDIAETALTYARACGLIDAVFTNDLLAGEPGAELSAFLAGTHIIYETGAVLDVLAPALALLLRTGLARGAAPWLLYSPRPDVDDAPLHGELDALDYRVETVNEEPVRYRRLIGDEEKAMHTDAVAALGRDPAAHRDGDWILVDLKLARPNTVAERLPVGGFRFNDGGVAV